MRVLFVYPNVRGLYMMPPAIGILSALLKNDGHDCRLFDTTYWNVPEAGIDSEAHKEKHLHVKPYEKNPHEVTLNTSDVYDEFNRCVEDFDPQLLAVSCTEDLFPFAIKLLGSLRRKGGIKTIIGGIFATFAPEKAIRCAEIDMLCIGEGEGPLRELCRRIDQGRDYSDVPNLWVKQDGTVRKNRMGRAEDIESIPLQDLDIFEQARFYRPFDGRIYKTFPVETHRGCPYRCAYCNSPMQMDLYKDKVRDNFLRLKSIGNVRRELRFYKDAYQAEYMYFWADTFLALSDQYLQELVEMYKSEIGLPFWCQTRPETLTEKRVKLLKDMGCHRVGVGVEHGNPKFRETMLDRKVGNDTIVRGLGILNDYGIKFSVNNIVGFPDETRELAFDTIELNRAIGADTHNMYTFVPFHGTALRDVAVKRGYIDPELVVTSLTQPTTLTMADFPREQIEGVKRCFVPYVLLEKARWPEIRKAEELSPAGDRIWEDLIEECRLRFFSEYAPARDIDPQLDQLSA
jgi:anaerobic magnesium-protoporphyrin IX monomethyl ester cyclase